MTKKPKTPKTAPVTRVKFTLNGRVIDMSIEEAQTIFKELKELFEGDKTVPRPMNTPVQFPGGISWPHPPVNNPPIHQPVPMPSIGPYTPSPTPWQFPDTTIWSEADSSGYPKHWTFTSSDAVGNSGVADITTRLMNAMQQTLSIHL